MSREDWSRADGQAPEDAGRPAASSVGEGFPRADLDKSCQEVVEEVRRGGSPSSPFRSTASEHQRPEREVLESRNSCCWRIIL
jgi:hypothetical protein